MWFYVDFWHAEDVCPAQNRVSAQKGAGKNLGPFSRPPHRPPGGSIEPQIALKYSKTTVLLKSFFCSKIGWGTMEYRLQTQPWVGKSKILKFDPHLWRHNDPQFPRNPKIWVRLGRLPPFKALTCHQIPLEIFYWRLNFDDFCTGINRKSPQNDQIWLISPTCADG